MNFSIDKNEFFNALSLVSHASASNSPQPALRGIKIDVSEDTILLTASDADLSIQMTMTKDDKNKMNVIEPGSILIETRYLLEIVKKLDADIINVEIIDGSLTKFSGTSAVYKINGMRVEDYPMIDFSKSANSITMASPQLLSIIEQTSFATSNKDTKPVLTGVNFHLENNVLNCIATDSFRLAKKVIPFESNQTFNITIPARALGDVRSTILSEGAKDIEIRLNDKKAQFFTDNIVIQTRLLDGGYPETERLIPKEFNYTLTMNRSDLISAIDRTTFIKNENMTINRMQCSKEEVILTNRSQEIGESKEVLVAQFEGEPLDISFSGNYVMDAAKALRGTKIMIRFNGEMKPFVLTSEEDDSVLQLVLPVRTYN